MPVALWLRGCCAASCFEESMYITLLRSQLVLDIATVSDNKPQLLTEGLTSHEIAQEARGIGKGKRIKSAREREFPLALIEKGYEIDIGTAQASRNEDIQSIINTVNKVPPEQILTVKPDLNSAECSKVNTSLRSVFAEAAIRGSSLEGGARFMNAINLLAKDTRRTRLTLDVMNVEMTDTNFFTAFRAKSMQKLVSLKVDLAGCGSLSDLTALAEGVGQLTSLQELKMDFSVCRGLGDVDSIGNALAQLPSLKKLGLRFSHCYLVENLSELSYGISRLGRSLEEITLNFQYCPIEGLCSVTNALQSLTHLQKLELDFSHCDQLTDDGSVSPLTIALKSLKNHLKSLKLHFRDCSKISGVGQIAEAIAELRFLKQLRIDFMGCSDGGRGLAGVGMFGQSISELSSLELLEISFDDSPITQTVLATVRNLKGVKVHAQSNFG